MKRRQQFANLKKEWSPKKISSTDRKNFLYVKRTHLKNFAVRLINQSSNHSIYFCPNQRKKNIKFNNGQKKETMAKRYTLIMHMKRTLFKFEDSGMVMCVCVCVYPSSSLGWRYGMNGNSGSCRQPN